MSLEENKAVVRRFVEEFWNRGNTVAALLQDLKGHLHGELICPDDHNYDAARRVWNGMIDKYPAAIVRCADVVDVVTAVRFARNQHMHVAVRSGGHSVTGSSVCDEGMVIDLSRMKGI
jgi:FAD/FMN-containing dehydrogenase